ncbi:MAG: radical SAM protein [Elusimicrobia bacterium]|nr:radical SAM protein [Elusimicrobiota bacterium]
MLNVGFILPSSEYLYDPFKGDPHTHFQILTVLESHFGNKLNLFLIDLRGIKKEFAIYHIPECDAYLHSVYTLDYEEQLSIVHNLRERYPKAKHIAGGPHATMFQKECLKTYDSLIIGDGENSIIQAITDIMNLKLNKIYKQTSSVNINLYPYPLRKYLPKSTIARKGLMTLKNKKGYENLLGTTVIFSRGCPYNCYFCAMPQVKEYSPGIRYRTPQLIKSEIEYLKRDYGLKGISLLDEIGIPPNPKKAISYLEAIGKTGIIWRGQCRVDGITPELAKLARVSGCVTMCFGVESVSKKALNYINKKIDIKRAKESIKLLKQNDIECRIYMIIGLPGEPEDIVEQTWAFIKDTSPDIVYLSLLTIRPGTEIYNNPDKFGIKKINTDWTKTMHMYGRYENEMPTLTFEYKEHAPWGKGFNKEKIINNYLELQTKLKEAGLAHI